MGEGLGLFSKRDHSLWVKITVWLTELNVNSLELVFLVTSNTWRCIHVYQKRKPKAPGEKQNPPHPATNPIPVLYPS